MPTEYRSVDTSTLSGLRQAEKLHRSGWIQYGVGLFIVKFYQARTVRAHARLHPWAQRREGSMRILANARFAYQTIGLRFAIRYLLRARRTQISMLDAWRVA